LPASKHLPFIVNSLDNESKSWADSIDIFTHDSLHYGRLSSIVKATMTEQISTTFTCLPGECLQHQDSHLLILQSCFPQNCQHFAVSSEKVDIMGCGEGLRTA
jgi:hypothetical protein